MKILMQCRYCKKMVLNFIKYDYMCDFDKTILKKIDMFGTRECTGFDLTDELKEAVNGRD